MMGSVDFAKLSVMEVLDLAILMEEAAGVRYGRLAKRMENLGAHRVATFFRTMKDTEREHAAQLMHSRKQRFGDAPTEVSLAMVPEVEAAEDGPLDRDASVHVALSLVLRAEVRAHGFFTQALAEATDPQVRHVLQALRREELEHQDEVLTAIERLEAFSTA